MWLKLANNYLFEAATNCSWNYISLALFSNSSVQEKKYDSFKCGLNGTRIMSVRKEFDFFWDFYHVSRERKLKIAVKKCMTESWALEELYIE